MITIHIENDSYGFYQHIAFDIKKDAPNGAMKVCTANFVNGDYKIWYEIREEATT